MDMTNLKNLNAGTTSINSMANKKYYIVRDKKVEQILQ
jgi:hypothetical protein